MDRVRNNVIDLAGYRENRACGGGTAGGGNAHVDVLIGEFEAWQLRRGLAGSTVERRRSHIDQFAGWLGGRDKLMAATWQDLEAFMSSLGHLAPQTVYDRLSHLHQFYRWCLRHGHVSMDPTVMIDRPKTPKHLPRPIRDRDLKLALQSAPPMTKAWIALGAYCGLRCAEIANIEAADVNGDTLFVVGKGSRERFVPIHPFVQECLDVLPLPPSGRIWLQPNGRPYEANHVSRLIGELFSDLGIDATAHQLRHWCGTMLRRITGDVFIVQQMLGHSDPKTSAIYSQVAIGEVRDAAARLPRVA